jgi:Cd2+/Zn2+-exporting ATPase
MSDSQKPTASSETGKCLARSVAAVLAQDSSLEAVTIDTDRKTISVATLGQTDVPRITEKISATVQRAEADGASHHCSLLQGANSCSTCGQPLSEFERNKILFSRSDSATTVARVTCPTAPKFWRWRDIPWPKVVQRDVEFLEHDHDVDEWKPQLAAAILCGVFGLLGWFLHHSTSWAVAGYLAAYLAGSWYTAQEVWERLRERAIDVHFLMLAVAVGSAFIGAWGEGAMLLFLFSFSSALEHFALGRTQREIRSLFKEAPKSATMLDAEGHEHEVPVDGLRVGVRLLIKPGSQFPVDAEVQSGKTAADESNLTGEATPVEKGRGDTVLAGTMNLWGAVQVSVLKPAAESSLQKIVHLIKEAQHQKAPAQQFTDKFSAYYTYAVLGLSFVMFFVWWLGFRQSPFATTAKEHSAFYHTMTLLVVASPCALVLSIPSAVLAAIAWSARQGILFRGGAAVEKLAEITTVALDKTGTLTTGEMRVERIESFPAGREQEIMELAYSLEKLSTHPLARAITRHGKQQDLPTLPLENFESVTGQGLKAKLRGQVCMLGRREWLLQAAPSDRLKQVPRAEPGLSGIWISCGDLLGRVLLRDDIRPQARAILDELQREGLRTLVLTGDRKPSAEHLQKELKLQEVRAELKPEDKLAVIKELTSRGERVAMVGDGVNDAPSLAAAHIGVAMGARGSDAALEQADVVLMHDRLENFLAAFRLSQRARAIIRQNLFVSLGTVLVLVTFALLGKIPLTLGVIGHEGSTVIVVMNSLRLLFGKAVKPLETAPGTPAVGN